MNRSNNNANKERTTMRNVTLVATLVAALCITACDMSGDPSGTDRADGLVINAIEAFQADLTPVKYLEEHPHLKGTATGSGNSYSLSFDKPLADTYTGNACNDAGKCVFCDLTLGYAEKVVAYVNFSGNGSCSIISVTGPSIQDGGVPDSTPKPDAELPDSGPKPDSSSTCTGTVKFKCVDSSTLAPLQCKVTEVNLGTSLSCTGNATYGACEITGLPCGKGLRFTAVLSGYKTASWPLSATVPQVILSFDGQILIHQFNLLDD
jgi:hypothetical protein